MSIFVTFDGDTHWLECFAADPDADHGDPIHPIDAGDTWEQLTERVNHHRVEHRCQPTTGATLEDR
jgi:hypothetical protein